MSKHHEQAVLLLRKADQDLLVIKKLRTDTEIAVGVLGFHAQQAAEKMLKAALADKQVRFPFTHRLIELIALIQTNDIAFPQPLEAIRNLTPFAVEFRYEDLAGESRSFNADETITLLTQLREWAVDIIQP